VVEYRCSYCNKLLLKWEGSEFTIQIKCWHCGAMHSFGMIKTIEKSPEDSVK